jgi:heme/copper-type cytochrome/quinol oxidase subunit 2
VHPHLPDNAPTLTRGNSCGPHQTLRWVFSLAMSALIWVIVAVVLIIIVVLAVVIVRRRRRSGGAIATRRQE